MDLKVNSYGQSFGAGRIPFKPSKIEEAANLMIKDDITGVIYHILPNKPQYMYASEKKIIQFPVMVNGVETVYNVRYPYAQNHIDRVGVEMTMKKGLDLQLMSAREIAKDIASKKNGPKAIVKTIAVG